VILSTAAVAAAEKDGEVLARSRAVVGPGRDRRRGPRRHSGAGHFTDPAGGGTAAVLVAALLNRLGITGPNGKKAVPFNTGREMIAAVLKGEASSASASLPSSFRSKA
jgi:hypothetical protein